MHNHQLELSDQTPREVLLAAGVQAYTRRVPTVFAIRYRSPADAEKVIAWIAEVREHGAIAASVVTVAHDGLMLVLPNRFERVYPGSVVVLDGDRLYSLTGQEFDQQYRPAQPGRSNGSR